MIVRSVPPDVHEDSSFYCAGCREIIEEPEDALAVSPWPRAPRVLHTIHATEACARKYYLGYHPCTAPPSLEATPFVGLLKLEGFEIVGLDDDRGLARIVRWPGRGVASS